MYVIKHLVLNLEREEKYCVIEMSFSFEQTKDCVQLSFLIITSGHFPLKINAIIL